MMVIVVNKKMEIKSWGVAWSVSFVYDVDVDEDDYDVDDGHGEYGNENNKMRCSAIGQC